MMRKRLIITAIIASVFLICVGYYFLKTDRFDTQHGVRENSGIWHSNYFISIDEVQYFPPNMLQQETETLEALKQAILLP